MPIDLPDIKGILGNGDYSLVVNGKSKHLDTDKEFNEVNPGFGILAEQDGKYLTAGGYKNSFNDDSYYLAGGLKKKFGKDFYVEPGIIGGVVSGYKEKLTPMVMPTLGVGLNGLGALNMMYAPQYEGNPATLMMNLNVPFK